MASRVRGNVHARFRGGEKAEITSKPYLFLSQTMGIKYCYLNSLAIATLDDPEADLHTDEVMQPNFAPQKNNSANSFTCHDCGSVISQKVADYSKSKFGRFLCLDCQRAKKSAA